MKANTVEEAQKEFESKLAMHKAVFTSDAGKLVLQDLKDAYLNRNPILEGELYKLGVRDGQASVIYKILKILGE